jgi:hypothetical protein
MSALGRSRMRARSAGHVLVVSPVAAVVILVGAAWMLVLWAGILVALAYAWVRRRS